MEHHYLEALQEKHDTLLKQIRDGLKDQVDQLADDANGGSDDDWDDDWAEEAKERLDLINRQGYDLDRLTVDEADDVLDILTNGSADDYFDDMIDQVQTIERQRHEDGLDEQWEAIQRFIANLNNHGIAINGIDTSTKSISTYITIPAGNWKKFTEFANGMADYSYFGYDPDDEEEGDDAPETPFTIRISDHEPGGRMGAYGYFNYPSDDVMISIDEIMHLK